MQISPPVRIMLPRNLYLHLLRFPLSTNCAKNRCDLSLKSGLDILEVDARGLRSKSEFEVEAICIISWVGDLFLSQHQGLQTQL